MAFRDADIVEARFVCDRCGRPSPPLAARRPIRARRGVLGVFDLPAGWRRAEDGRLVCERYGSGREG